MPRNFAITTQKVIATCRFGFGGLLAIVFIVLKLTGVVAWSWLWVLSPLWISFVLFLLVVVLAAWADS